MRKRELSRIKKCWVDTNRCLWHTLCLSEAPNAMKAGAEDGPPAFSTSDEGVLNIYAKEIFAAASVCPVAAINIELEDGTVIHRESAAFKDYARVIQES